MMADILRALARAGSQASQSNTSQESSHSISDHPSPPVQSNGLGHEAGKVCSVDAYLADPVNVAYLTSITAPSSLRKGQQSTSTSDASPMDLDDVCTPIEVNTRTSHHVPALNNLCQTRGITPIYNISGEVDRALFTGSLKVGNVTFTLDEECRSKKEVKERLAEQALEAVKSMDSMSKEDQSADGEGANWVGILQEYHNQRKTGSSPQSPIYTLYALGSCWAYTCKIPAYPDRCFGASTTPFAGKKQARAYAAKEAVAFLITEGELNPDGSVVTRGKKAKVKHSAATEASSPSAPPSLSSLSLSSSTTAPTSAPSSTVFSAINIPIRFDPGTSSILYNPNTSHAQRVNDLCSLLGLTLPQYHIQAPSPTSAPNILNGYATFPCETTMGPSTGLESGGVTVGSVDGRLTLSGHIGEARHVFGKKNAKEEIATGVWAALVRVAEQRGFSVRKG